VHGCKSTTALLLQGSHCSHEFSQKTVNTAIRQPFVSQPTANNFLSGIYRKYTKLIATIKY